MELTPWLTKEEYNTHSADFYGAAVILDALSESADQNFAYVDIDENNNILLRPKIENEDPNSAYCWKNNKWDIFVPGEGGGSSTDGKYWRPDVNNETGVISWALNESKTPPESANIKGKDGNTPSIGNNGNWWIGTTDTGVKAEGKDGKDGAGVAVKGQVATKAQLPTVAENGDAYIVTDEDGKLFVYADGWPDKGVAFTGPAGADGNTPFIGTNGNWWIGTTDTGVVAKGVNGADGKSVKVERDDANKKIRVWVDGDKDHAVDVLDGTNGTNGVDGKDGKDGVDGKDGSNGLTPYIGDDGNWYTGETSTGKPSRGENGSDGKNASIDISTDTVDASTEHPNGGTKVTLTPYTGEKAETPESFNIWNGNDGSAAGVTQGTGIKITGGEVSIDSAVVVQFPKDKSNPQIMQGGEWVDGTKYKAMYKTSDPTKAGDATQVIFNWHGTLPDIDGKYNYIEVYYDGNGSPIKVHTLANSFAQSLTFTDETLSGTYSNTGMWDLKANPDKFVLRDGDDKEVTKQTTFTGGVTFKNATNDVIPAVYKMDNWNESMKFKRGENEVGVGVSMGGDFTIKPSSWQFDFGPNGRAKSYIQSDTAYSAHFDFVMASKLNDTYGCFKATQMFIINNQENITEKITENLPRVNNGGALFFVIAEHTEST